MSTQTPPSPAYPYKVVGYANDGSELRKFADSNIQAAIDKVVADELQGKWDHAIIGHYVETPEGKVIQGVVLFNKKVGLFGWQHDFTVAGSLSHNFTTGDTKKEAWVSLRG